MAIRLAKKYKKRHCGNTPRTYPMPANGVARLQPGKTSLDAGGVRAMLIQAPYPPRESATDQNNCRKMEKRHA